ncbi:hypothetical protein ABW20_dc0100236 [Dactylellina cionopaga]|nr:hypothetical protein ABW20_dc0100236 [Dactylellina cionopaga]
MAIKPRTHSQYNIGWVCALPKEQTAATAMLDETHDGLSKTPNDDNIYTLGSIGKHNIVIACLPKGKLGAVSAATVAVQMAGTFTSIKFVLMVGIGGGVPNKGKIRLGDVVVGTPTGKFPGVVQWDFGKATKGSFERTGALNNPPKSLLTAISKLETHHEMHGSEIARNLAKMKEKWPKLSKYLRSESLEDILFKSTYSHVSKPPAPEDDDEDDEEEEEEDEEEDSCRYCEKTKILKRKPRDLKIHYGLIASGNQLIEDAIVRDKLNKSLGGSTDVLCIETEAAGILNDFPCLVIRGICNYADSHKVNQDWQEHAAGAAAAFAKELLGYVQPNEVEQERPVKELLDQSKPYSIPNSLPSRLCCCIKSL